MGSPAFEPQRVLAGRYRLEERLGAGGMGAIWRAEHLVLQAPVAVKLIDRDAVHDEQTVTRFLREAKAAAALRSPHVVQILDYGMDEGVPFIVMELLEGETLAQRLKRVRRLTATDTARFVSHVGRAIGRAHEAGIVHRDLKPENVFIVQNEDEDIAKVLDFGVAKVDQGVLAVEGERTRTGSILGTPYYMSPEQAQGNKAVDHRSDLWSLAVIAFECLTGKRPFYSEGLGDLVLQICVRQLPVPSEVAAVPAGFDAWFARAVARDPGERFQSAREMTDALREALCVEARDVSGSQPEVGGPNAPVSTNYLAPRSDSKSGPSQRLEALQSGERAELETLAQEAPHSDTEADPTAPTLAHSPERVEAELPRLASAGHDSGSGSGLGTVVFVAAFALAIGLGGGVYALRKLGANAVEPAPSVPQRVPSEPSVRQTQRRSSSAARHDAPDMSESTAPSVPAPSASPSASARAAAPLASATAHEKRELPSVVDAGVRPALSADGGWVKPAWAIPDPEPKHADDVDEAPQR